MKTTTILLALAFGITACSASTGEELPTQDDNSANDSGDVRYDVVYLIHGHYGTASTHLRQRTDYSARCSTT